MINIDKAKCIGCGLCAADCLGRAISLESGQAEIVKDCFMCGHCVAVCPQEAVSIEGDGYEMEGVEPVGSGFGIDGDVMLHAIKTRRSIRHFKDKAVDRALLERIIEAGRFSPTASNAQNVSYMVFPDAKPLNDIGMAELRRFRDNDTAFHELFPSPFSKSRVRFDEDDFLFKGGRAAILTVSPHAVNAAIATANMELEAVSLGLGALYVGYFVRLAEKCPALRRHLGLKEGDNIVTCLVLGWPDVTFLRTPPRRRAEVIWR